MAGALGNRRRMIASALVIFAGLAMLAEPAAAQRRTPAAPAPAQPSPSAKAAAAAMAAVEPADRTIYLVKQSAADPSVQVFNEPNYITFNGGAGPTADLLVFLGGPSSKPEAHATLLNVAAAGGYRVIGLQHNDTPATVAACASNPDLDCSAKFRQKRAFGDNVTTLVDNTPAQAIVPRLIKLLQYLDQKHPGEGWGGYLSGGEPNWGRIVLAGHSQGAGMAAFIAKQKAVARVVLFSGPWDFYASTRKSAQWLTEAGATPPDRWFATYHRREDTAAQIVQAYSALGIPEANLRPVNLDLQSGARPTPGLNQFHTSPVANTNYLPEWQFLFGRSR
ncbi:MAG: hypothetical protein U1E56_07715 [Bauldia sp.]